MNLLKRNRNKNEVISDSYLENTPSEITHELVDEELEAGQLLDHTVRTSISSLREAMESNITTNESSLGGAFIRSENAQAEYGDATVTYRAVVATSFNDPSSRVRIERVGRMIELATINDRGGGGSSVSVRVRENDDSKWSVTLEGSSSETALYRSIGRNAEVDGVVPELESIVLDIDAAVRQLQ